MLDGVCLVVSVVMVAVVVVIDVLVCYGCPDFFWLFWLPVLVGLF